MARFHYTAKNTNGATVSGYVEADTSSSAAVMIREMGYYPLRVEAEGSEYEHAGTLSLQGVERRLVNVLWPRIGIRPLLLFFRQFGVLLGTGMTVSEALASVLKRQRGHLAKIIAEMQMATSSGESLSVVMNRHRDIFSPLQIAMVRVGESSGMLQRVIEQIASYLEHEAGIRDRITRALFYPLVLVSVLMVWQVAMGLIQGGPGGAASAIRALVLGELLPIMAVVFVARIVFQFKSAKAAWDFVKLQIPWIGTAARKIAMSRFCRAFGLLHSSGVAVGQALVVAADASGNLVIRKRIRDAVPAVNSGCGVAESLRKSGALTPIVLDMLDTGEKTGNFDSVLEKAADYLDQEVDTTMHKAAVLAFVIPFLLIAIQIAMTVISFYSGFLSSTFNLAE